MDTELLAFLLREPGLYVKDNFALRQEVNICKNWIEELTQAARQMNIPRGQLCRDILPFSESTDAKDQANVQDKFACPLRQGAVRMRKFLRLKISDENDLRQAIDALGMIESALIDN